MKFRNGFVSNSSSSSFIIAIGKVDHDKSSKFHKWMEEIKKAPDFYSYGIKTFTKEHLLKMDEFEATDLKIKVNKDRIINIACVNSEPSISTNIEEDEDTTEYFIVNIGNDEGDDQFWDEEYCEMDYDKVDEDWFSGYQEKILKELNKRTFFKEVSVLVGADRNG